MPTSAINSLFGHSFPAESHPGKSQLALAVLVTVIAPEDKTQKPLIDQRHSYYTLQ